MKILIMCMIRNLKYLDLTNYSKNEISINKEIMKNPKYLNDFLNEKEDG